jgi:conserved domain protein
MKLIASSLLVAFFMAGCASKSEVIVKTQYQDVYVPVACIEKMPTKPKFSPENLESAKELMGYFLTCEELLKGCVNGSNHKEN